MSLAYCDYIAHTIIVPGLTEEIKGETGLIVEASKVKMDLHKEGWMQSTRKTIMCKDTNGKEYKITVEEI
jgi:hypothetical protein